MSELQIAQLVYLASCWYLAIHHVRLIDVDILVGENGMYILSLDKALARTGEQVDHPLRTPSGEELWIPHNDHEAHTVIDRVWSTYRVFSGIQLTNLVNGQDSLWVLVHNRGFPTDGVLPDDLVIEHYEALARTRSQYAV